MRFYCVDAQQFCSTPKCVNSRRESPLSQEFSLVQVFLHNMMQNRLSCSSHSFKFQNTEERRPLWQSGRGALCQFLTWSVLIKEVFSPSALVKLLVPTVSLQSSCLWISATLPWSFHLKLIFYIVLAAFYHVLRDYFYSVTDFTLQQNQWPYEHVTNKILGAQW